MINVYVPPPFQKTFNGLYKILYKLALLMPLKVLIAGDFNNILDFSLDTSNPNRVPNLELPNWADSALLTELWWWKHPALRQYSFLSTVFHSSSRIDLAFANSALLPWVIEAIYLAGGISNHVPLLITLQLPDYSTPRM